MIVKQDKLSDRQMLFNRVTVARLADRLSHNLEKLNQTETRLSFSRCHSSDSSSRSSLKRGNSLANLNQSESKARLLRNIADKLKQSKGSLHKTPVVTDNNIPQERESLNTSRKRKNKLEQMLKDIKKCNQMSTKAVHSIKKNIIDGLDRVTVSNFNPTLPRESIINDIKTEQTEKQPNPSQITILFNELNNLKKEMTKLKEDNANLIQIIKLNHFQERGIIADSKNCLFCGCNCHSQKIKNHGYSKTANYE